MIAEYFAISFISGIVLSSIYFWKFKSKLQHYKIQNSSESSTNGRRYETVNLWASLKLFISILKWSWDESLTKRHLIEEVCTQLKKISSLGKPKLFRIFNFNVVINDDFESITSVLHSKKVYYKLPESLKIPLSNGKSDAGILLNHGPTAKELRKYTIKKLGQLGFGKSDHLSLILSDLLPDLLNHVEIVKKSTSNKILVQNLFTLYVINVVWCTIGGKKFSESDENYVTLYKNLNKLGNFPFFKSYFGSHLPNNKFVNTLFGFDDGYKIIKNSNDYFMAFIKEKEYLSRKKHEPEDFVDHFLLEIEKQKDDEEMKHIYNKEQLATVLQDFFAAGLDTTSKYLEMFLMYMILNPKVQRKVQEEIDLIVPPDGIPLYSEHRQSMPYMCATMMEVHRMGSVSPAISRYIPKTLNALGKVSEERTQIVNMMWALRMDVSFWGDPHIFRPERFLNADDTFVADKMSRVMPFGAGSRMCPGENVSTASSFTFLVAILRKYGIRKAFEDEFLGIEKKYRVISQTVPFHMALEERLL